MNVPVPPIFLFEYDIGRYEVMDGQQRLNTIVGYITNDFKLSGLKVWSSLNGKQYSKLPARIRRGLERAKISSIILLADVNAGETDPAIGDIRTQVFDRLNTGGIKLNAQELRNSLYSGPLNNLIVQLASGRPFTDAWGIPAHEEHIGEDGTIGDKLRMNSLYAQMKDCEIVLRFLAFRNEENIKGSVRTILDRFMEENRRASEEAIEAYKFSFDSSFELAIEVFG